MSGTNLLVDTNHLLSLFFAIYIVLPFSDSWIISLHMIISFDSLQWDIFLLLIFMLIVRSDQAKSM